MTGRPGATLPIFKTRHIIGAGTALFLSRMAEPGTSPAMRDRGPARSLSLLCVRDRHRQAETGTGSGSARRARVEPGRRRRRESSVSHVTKGQKCGPLQTGPAETRILQRITAVKSVRMGKWQSPAVVNRSAFRRNRQRRRPLFRPRIHAQAVSPGRRVGGGLAGDRGNAAAGCLPRPRSDAA
jgi:hypothetical protein